MNDVCDNFCSQLQLDLLENGLAALTVTYLL